MFNMIKRRTRLERFSAKICSGYERNIYDKILIRIGYVANYGIIAMSLQLSVDKEDILLLAMRS